MLVQFTVYDYVDNEQTKNPDHTYAMQPIVLKMANSDGYADYSDGLEPTRLIEEDITNLGVLGNFRGAIIDFYTKSNFWNKKN